MDVVWTGAALVFSLVLASLIGRAGWIKAFTPIASMAGSGLVWVSDVPRGAVRALGALELVAAVVLVLAPLARFTPFDTSWASIAGIAAAVGVGLLMASAHVFHLRRGEANYTWPANLAFGALAVLSASSQFVSA